MKRYYYSETIADFLDCSPAAILGELTSSHIFSLEPGQRDAWIEQIHLLQNVLQPYRNDGKLYFEYSIPRLGRRIDVIVILRAVIFVLEFKVGEREFTSAAVDQVWDYALDLKNFHEASHDKVIAPVLVATAAQSILPHVAMTPHNDQLLLPIRSNAAVLGDVIRQVIAFTDGPCISAEK